MSDLFQNNDRDHDGLTDAAEAVCGTNPNLADTDGDGLSDGAEMGLGSNPTVSDTDGDGAPDAQDSFPLDPNEWLDTDGDGIGDNADPDDDNDGCWMGPTTARWRPTQTNGIPTRMARGMPANSVGNASRAGAAGG